MSDFRIKYQMVFQKFKTLFTNNQDFPSNILVLGTHSTARIPFSIYPKLSRTYKASPRLLLNYSDYGTQYLLKDIPDQHKIIAPYGRIIGDPNRSLNDQNLFRFTDFGGIRIFNEGFEKQLTKSWLKLWWRRKLLKKSYLPYYENIYQRLKNMVNDPRNQNKPIVILDIHDTGNLILGATPKEDKYRDRVMPKVLLSNAPDIKNPDETFGTCPENWLHYVQDLMAQYFKIKPTEVELNTLFKGGNIIHTFGNPHKNKKLKAITKHKPIFAIQIEFDRGMYMNESTQRPKWMPIRNMRQSFHKILCQLDTGKALEESDQTKLF